MPAYNNATGVPSIEPGGFAAQLLDGTDTIYGNTPYAGQEVALAAPVTISGRRLRFEGTFSGPPGAFEVDLQEAATDAATNYKQVVGATVTQADANNTFAVDVIDGMAAQFVRPYVKSLANDVTLELTVRMQ